MLWAWNDLREASSFTALEADQVLIGAQLAELLELGALESHPVVTIQAHDFRVVGIIEQSPRIPKLMGEIIVASDAAGFESPKTISALIRTSAGAAQQVASQTAVALNPYRPESIQVNAPTDSAALRTTVEQGVQSALIAFTVLAIIVAIAALSNAMLLAITARRGEIGMRKALGARSRHIACSSPRSRRTSEQQVA